MFFSSAKTRVFAFSSSAHRFYARDAGRDTDRRTHITITTTTTTTTTTTPMMKTKRAFLRNSIRGARTLVFSRLDSSDCRVESNCRHFYASLDVLGEFCCRCGVAVWYCSIRFAVFVCVCVFCVFARDCIRFSLTVLFLLSSSSLSSLSTTTMKKVLALSPFIDQRSFRLYTSSRKNVEIDIISQIAARNGTNDYTYNRDSSLLISMYQSNDTHIYI